MLQFNLFEHLWEGALGSNDGTGLGYPRMFSPHRRPYATKDGHICLLAVNNEQWRRLLCAIDKTHVLDDPRFCHMAERMRNINELYRIVGDAIRNKTTAEWNAIFASADVPHGPVRDLKDLMQDAYIKETGFFQRVEHPTEGDMVMTSIPVHFSASPGNVRYLPPNLGEHSIEVLIEAGYSAQEASALFALATTKPGAVREAVAKH
jgi:formyl-CoA transferase